ncbi:MAG: hypothetical protein NPIRA06_09460 [Nitrospirales bacterium]|nr:MAG: hypothetical protein NPIRA06_09460 [Nitrospirales bacterium]
MRVTTDDSEFSEVFIESHKHAPFLMGAGEDFVIPWINIPGSSPNNVMPSSFEDLNGTTPNARIE